MNFDNEQKILPDNEENAGYEENRDSDPENDRLIVNDQSQQIFENSDHDIGEDGIDQENVHLDAQRAYVLEAIEKEYQKKY